MMNSNTLNLSRRGFLFSAVAGAGMASFGFTGLANAKAETKEINAWVVIHADERVEIRIARTEMGQGSLTGLAQLVAEELECDWDKVTYDLVQPADNHARNKIWRDMTTGGSTAIRGSQEYLRQGGATARAMLIQTAANKWGVPAKDCTVSKGVVIHAASGRQLTYGTLAQEATKLTPPAEVVLKSPDQWSLIGKPVRRLDTRAKLTGEQVYGADISFPGMLVALPKSCPVHGGKLRSFDAKAVSKMAGVKHVLKVDDETVAVVADGFWNAKQALDALPVQWDTGEAGKASTQSLTDFIRTGLTGPADKVDTDKGDAEGKIAASKRVVEAEYGFPYLNHAPMETMSAVVKYTADGCEVWAPTQVAQSALEAVSKASGHAITACKLNTMLVGGSFGRRLTTEYIEIAIRIAKQLPGQIVKMMYTREEDMAQGRFHPMTRCKLRASLTDKGELEAMHVRIAGQSILAFMMPEVVAKYGDKSVFQGFAADGVETAIGYTIPNLKVDYAMRNSHVRPGWWRGVNLNQNAVYLECFMDEVAAAAGKDPVEFRRELMHAHPKHKAVLDAVAKGIGWGRKMPAGHGLGVAQIMGFGSYVAAAAEVSVIDGKLKIHKIVASTNPGHVVNPQQAEAQIAGSFSYGLGVLLHGGNSIEEGRIAETNFDNWDVMRLPDMPDVEVILQPTGDFWGGIGEPTIAVAAPAVMNAIYAATGKRIRDLPVKL